MREKFAHLVTYVSRPPIATERFARTGGGNVRYTLKTPYRNGTYHVLFEPEEFIARLAALVSKPRAHLIRFHYENYYETQVLRVGLNHQF